MTIESIIALTIAVFIFAVTPGPAIFACVAQGLSHGFRSSIALNLGIVLGDIIFLLFAIFGLSAVARFLGGLFLFVKIAGGIYLMWLGWKMWKKEPVAYSAETTDISAKFWKTFLAGLIVTLSNPKVILFYIGFLPAFMDLTALTAADVLIVSVIITIVLTAVNWGYAYSADRARKLFTSRRANRLLNRSAGTVMIGTGVVIVSR